MPGTERAHAHAYAHAHAHAHAHIAGAGAGAHAGSYDLLRRATQAMMSKYVRPDSLFSSLLFFSFLFFLLDVLLAHGVALETKSLAKVFCPSISIHLFARGEVVASAKLVSLCLIYSDPPLHNMAGWAFSVAFLWHSYGPRHGIRVKLAHLHTQVRHVSPKQLPLASGTLLDRQVVACWFGYGPQVVLMVR
ncbi:uncharacterized protein UV8b_01949 [Ustilaginoidea virens]|uniref:Uncharacterized protein n=1 Tax=Ustilaginoidea virens TaxID=1159556 RepID=A0A8E5HLW9_USTVR|nr:uncharacterized protein UV8b_01949 [Ustilaginoidea virens]QUC17708.1 hypothetical protein UV8b_01949 [Ustilaginoidea virens]